MPKRKQQEEEEIGEEIDVLDRFANPEKKKKKLATKKAKEKEKFDKIINRGKKFAKDYFNECKLADTEYNLLETQIDKETVQKSIEDLRNLLEGTKDIDLEKVCEPKYVKGIEAVVEFMMCAERLRKWLDTQLHELGWKQNMTNYDPICVSHSIGELITSVLEAYRMAIKQMIVFQTVKQSKLS